MNQNKYVFAQLVAFLDWIHFIYLARKYSCFVFCKYYFFVKSLVYVTADSSLQYTL